MPPDPNATFIRVQQSIVQALREYLRVPPQAILNVEVRPRPTTAEFNFETLWPAAARIDVFRMVHGELSLDMEPEHLAGTEVEFSTHGVRRHSLLLGGLEQEKRYWYRISVPRRSPGQPQATGEVEYRGAFATRRRNVTITIDRLDIIDDSDTGSAGNLEFATTIYDATVPAGARLTDLRYSGYHERDSGGEIEAPFGPAIVIGRAPEALGIFVMGRDDDAIGLPAVGFYAPDQMPAPRARSNSYLDSSDALGFVDTAFPTPLGQVPFSFHSIQGALYYQVSGTCYVQAVDTLGELPNPPWKRLLAAKTWIYPGQAAKVQLQGGRVGLALSAGGQLSRLAAGSGGRWNNLDIRPLRQLLVHLSVDGSQVLAGLDDGGRLHVARLGHLDVEEPRWRTLDLLAAEVPGVLDGIPSGVHVLATDAQDVLWHVRLDAEGDGDLRAVRLAERVSGQALGRPIGEGRLVVVHGSGHGPLHVLTVERDGGVDQREQIEGEFGLPLAIVEDEDEDDGKILLLAALDAQRRVAVRRLFDREGRWRVLGTLDEVLEGPLGRIPLDEPRPQRTTAAETVQTS